MAIYFAQINAYTEKGKQMSIVATDFARVNENIAKGKQLSWWQKLLLKVSNCQTEDNLKTRKSRNSQPIPRKTPVTHRSDDSESSHRYRAERLRRPFLRQLN